MPLEKHEELEVFIYALDVALRACSGRLKSRYFLAALSSCFCLVLPCGFAQAVEQDVGALMAQPTPDTISGQIQGLRSDGLLLSDGGRGATRPRANDRDFWFATDLSTKMDTHKVRLLVVRQPMTQRCQVAMPPDSQGLNALVRCFDLNSDEPNPHPKETYTLWDCLAPQVRGSSYTLRWANHQGFRKLLHVTLDSVGVDRIHHRVIEGGRLLMESIVRYPGQESRAMLETLWISPTTEGAAFRTEGLSGGMPLDLKAGEKTTYQVTLREAESGQRSPTIRVLRYEAELIHIGMLVTPVAEFPLSCHVRERNLETGMQSETWFVPGFGVLKTKLRNREGAVVVALELLKIHQRPDDSSMTDRLQR